jgi:prepilin-type N-terminal cleavage/methylation domain-containing protein
MRSFFTNQKGITLVELLAVLALICTVMLLINNVHFFGQKQFSSQSKQVQHESNVRYAMNVITKDIRTSPPQTISVANNRIETSNGAFRLQGSTLYKDDKVLEEGIAEFTVEQNGNEIVISMKSVPNQFDKAASLSTNLYIRE